MALKATGETRAKDQRWERLNAFLSKYGIVLILLAMMLAFSLLSEGFFTTRNIFNIIRQISFMGLIAIGVTMVIITGGIDLGSGSVLALTAVLATSLAQLQTSATLKYPGLEVPVIVPIVVALGVGALTGVINGSLISKFKIPPFIATLGMMTVARGFALIYSNKPLSQLTPEYNFIGQGAIFGVPFPVILLILVAVTIHIMLNNTPFGRYIYALGGNEQAARISGVNIDRVKIGVYTLAGLLSGLAGLVVSSRVGSGQPGQGVGIELDAIAAAVIGGTSLSGGIGTIWGTMVGAMIIGVLDNGLILLNVDQYWITIVKGTIIVVAVIIDQRKNR
ncbi:MAG TPA: ABC transporter permease [Chloroflexi bacterium]|nr:ABC transporter permease [Chloroflexota bacterium]